MNEISQIVDKVPSHWEIVPFTKVVNVFSDGGKRIKKKSYLEFGTILIIDQGQKYSSGFTNDEKMLFSQNFLSFFLAITQNLLNLSNILLLLEQKV